MLTYLLLKVPRKFIFFPEKLDRSIGSVKFDLPCAIFILVFNPVGVIVEKPPALTFHIFITPPETGNVVVGILIVSVGKKNNRIKLNSVARNYAI